MPMSPGAGAAQVTAARLPALISKQTPPDPPASRRAEEPEGPRVRSVRRRGEVM